MKKGQRVVVSHLHNRQVARSLGVSAGDEGFIVGVEFRDIAVKLDHLDKDYHFWPDEIAVIEPSQAPSVKSDGGGGQNYYDLPKGATQLQDLIEHRNMNGNVKDIFKSCYRAGLKDGTSEEYDARKRAYYSLRELGRLLGRKDYITIAKELIAHQAIEEEEDEWVDL